MKNNISVRVSVCVYVCVMNKALKCPVCKITISLYMLN